MSYYKTEMQIKAEHEAFKNRLVAEVLGQESGGKVPMEKVVMLIWQFRDDPTVVTYLARFVNKYAGSRQVFDGVEFYLPQLAHMIIHLEAEWDDAILERFALVIAQQSLHFALQFNWILQGAIEDYQPELPSGLPNPNFQPLYYARCMKLLANLERCVVYGRPRSKQFQRLYEQGKITKSDLHILENADRRFHALQLTSGDGDHIPELEDIHTASGNAAAGSTGRSHTTNFGGHLLYKRQVRLGCFRRKGWKKRYFVIDEQMLNCYRNEDDARKRRGLLRAMPLEGATYEIQETKYQHMFIVSNRNYRFFLRASSAEDRTVWMRMLEQENDISSLFQSTWRTGGHPTNNSGATTERQQQVVADLTPIELARYEFFRNECNFTQRLTDIAEELRFEEPADRKRIAPGLMESCKIPPCVYLPLCNSTDVWRRTIATFHKDVRVFNTKERCPTVMYFLVKLGEGKKRSTGSSLDVAEYMYQRFEELGSIPSSEMTPVEETVGEDEENEDEGMANNVDLDRTNTVTTEEGWVGAVSVEEKSSKSKNEERADDMGVSGRSGNYIVQLDDTSEGPDNNVPRTIQSGGRSTVEEGLEVTETDFVDVVKEKEEKHSSAKKDMSKALSSKVWHVEDDEKSDSFALRDAGGDPNKKKERVANMIRDLPRKLQTRLEANRRGPSVLDLATDLQLVPILEGPRVDATNGGKDDDDRSVGSIERGSQLFKDTVRFGDLDEGDISVEHINRAKQIVSGGESWAEKSARMLKEAAASQKHLEDPSGETDMKGAQLEVSSLISKSNDDVRQEVFVMQMIHYYKSVFAKAKLPLWLKTYRILSTAKYTGLLEFVVDATSIDGLKKSPGFPEEGGLRQYFLETYGAPDGRSFKAAQTNFMQSLAAYSLVSYFLGLKDRHNGNIMIDTRGHVIHIDFGFAMGIAPGNEFSFERAPFKFTTEYLEVMGGVDGDCYKEFERLFVAGFLEARKNSQIALGLVEIMMFKSNYPCFTGRMCGGGLALKNFEKRLMIHVPDDQVEKRALALVHQAREHYGTYLYDKFQKATCGYAM